MFKLILLFVAFLLSASVNADPITLKVGTGEYSPTIGAKLKHGGYATHMLTLAFESQGITLDIEYVPWKRAMIGTKNGDYDFTFYWFCTEERRQDFYCGDALVESRIHFFHLKSLEFDWQNYEDIKPYFIGLTASYHYSNELTQMVNEGKVRTHVTTRDKDNVNMLLANRIDLFPMTVLEGLYLIHNSFPPESANQITYHPKALTTPTGHPLFPKNNLSSKKWMDLYAKGIKKLKEQGTLEAYKLKMINGWYEP